MYKKITREKAESLYDSGKSIYLQSNRMAPDNMWQPAAIVTPNGETTFKQVCNTFRYYNCDVERGKGIQFYVWA